jgi:dehydrogenase/reductase SDR family protein 13
MAPGDLAGRNFFVTGANSGVGRSMTEALAARGASIVMAARSEERTRPVIDGIRRQFPSSDIQWLQIDLADLDSVRRAAGEYLGSGKPIDVLVNNAGIAGTNALSPQGFDVTYATNHIGPFLLTNLLLPRIRESTQGRIVNVASSAHFTVKQIDWTTLDRRTTPRRSAFPDYAMTKLMNVLHAKELARRLTGTAVTTYAVHPGAVATNIWRSLPGAVQWFIKLFMLSNEQGAVPLVYCATAPELASQTGRYYNRSHEIAPSPLAADDNLARELWIRTEAIVGA